MANEAIEVEGLVLEILWWGKYKVQILDMDMEVEAYAAGKMKRYRIKIIPWDLVTVELNTYEPTKWRIVYRTINNGKNKKQESKYQRPDKRGAKKSGWDDKKEISKKNDDGTIVKKKKTDSSKK